MKKIRIRSFFDGSLIIHEKVLDQWGYFVFLVLLGIFFIANNYRSEKIVRETNVVKRELKALQTEHLAVLSELMKVSQQSEVAGKVEESGLKESVVPPKKIFVNKK